MKRSREEVEVKREQQAEKLEGNQREPEFVVLRTCSVYGDHSCGAYYARFEELKRLKGESFDWKEQLVGSGPSDREKEGIDQIVYDKERDKWTTVEPWKELGNYSNVDTSVFDFTMKHHCVVVQVFSDE